MPQNTPAQTIGNVRDEIIVLASMVEKAMLDSVEALKNRHVDSSKEIFHADKLINKKRFELEGLIIRVIGNQQPSQQELRKLTSMLDMCTELERMGDYAKGLASINIRSKGLKALKILEDLHYMAEQAVDMLHRAISAFINEDIESASTIAKEDILINAIYKQIYYEIMDLAVDDTEKIEYVNFYLWSAHNIERFADRVTNICERTIFVATGEWSELPDQHPEPMNVMG